MKYKTGRTRTLMCSGNLTGLLSIPGGPGEIQNGGIGGIGGSKGVLVGGGGSSSSNWPGFSIGFAGFTLTASMTRNALGVNGWTVTAQFAAQPSITGSQFIPAPADGWSLDCGGTYSISTMVEEIIQIEYGTYSGFDGPPITRVTFYERIIPGTIATGAITSGGVTATSTYTAGGTEYKIPNYVVGLYGIANASNASEAVAITSSVNGSPPDFSGFSTGFSGIFGGAFTGSLSTNGGISINFTANNASGSLSSFSQAAPVQKINVQVVARTPFGGYGGTVGMRMDGLNGLLNTKFDVVGGQYSTLITQRLWDSNLILFVNGAGVGWQDGGAEASQQMPFAIRTRPGAANDGDLYSLLAIGETSLDSRVMVRGHSFNSFTVQQASSLTVDACSALNSGADPYAGLWENVSNTALSVSGGIQAVVSGGSGTFRRRFTPKPAGLSGYAYLALTVSASADSSPFKVSIGSKYWTKDKNGNSLTANIAGSQIVIDLCNPQSETVAVDSQDVRWPNDTEAPYWGVKKTSEITFSNLTNGVTYTISALQLTRSADAAAAHSKISFLPGFNTYYLERTGTQSFVMRGAWGDTDGKCSLDLPYLRLLNNSTLDVPISAWINEMQPAAFATNEGCPIHAGWLATSNNSITVDPIDYQLLSLYLNNFRPSAWAYGGGALWSGTNWDFGQDKNAGSLLTVKAQMLMDYVTWYPGAGEIFGGGYGDTTTIRAAFFLSADGWGYVLNPDGTRVANAKVTASDIVDGGSSGLAMTTSLGEYQTAEPGARSKNVTRVKTETQQFDRPWRTRHRWRCSFRDATVAESNPWNLEDEFGMYHRVSVRAGMVRYRRAAFPTPKEGWVVDKTITAGTDSDPRMIKDWRGRVILLFCRGGIDTYEIYSDDDGISWSDPVMAITGGVHPTIATAPEGGILRAAYVAGKLKGTFQSKGDDTPSAVFTMKDDIGTDLAPQLDTFHIQYGYEGAARWFLTCLIVADTAPSDWFSADNGRTWKRIT